MRVLVVDNSGGRGPYTSRLIRCLRADAVVTEAEFRKTDVRSFDLLVLSGSDQTFSEGTVTSEALRVNYLAMTSGVPVLGICFGMQVMAVLRGGIVRRCPGARKGWKRLPHATAPATPPSAPLLPPLSSLLLPCFRSQRAYFDHKDCILRAPPSFLGLRDKEGLLLMMQSTDRRFMGVQFHPEMSRFDVSKWLDSGGRFRALQPSV